MSPAPIFISYRRDDSAGYARAVYDALAREFGVERVFIDVDDIAAGQAFDDTLHQAVVASRVLLVLVGPRWRGERDDGSARIDDPADFVHQEVAAGLAHGMRVIPLLVDGATLPAEARLPAPLQPLVRRQALAIGHDRFAADVARLVAALRQTLGEAGPADPAPQPPPPPPGRWGRRHRVVAGIAGVVLAAAVVVVAPRWLVQRAAAPGASGQAAAPATPPAARAAVNGRWTTELRYDWSDRPVQERFEFSGEGSTLQGTASFLRVDRGIVEGRVEAGGLAFVTRTQEVLGSDGPGREVTHRYLGRLDGDELRGVLQTEGSAAAHPPVSFVARRVAP